MKKRIKTQFLLLTFAAIIAAVTISTWVFYNILKHEVISDLKAYTEIMARTDAWEMITDPEHTGSKGMEEDAGQIRITLISSNGNVLSDTGADTEIMSNHSERPEIADAFSNGEGSAIRKSETIGKSLFYYAIRLDNGCVLRVSKEVENIYSVIISALPVISVICAVLFIVCIMFSNVLTKSIIQPIEHLAENLDASSSVKVYKELVPFVTTIRRQHEDIMRNANMRQEFTANVSHELKTPLTSISGYSELIESGMANEADTIRFAREIHKSSNRLLTLINDIIRLSELDQTSSTEVFEEVDLYDVASSCVEMLDLNAKKNKVTMNIYGSSQIVTASRQMMEELIYNLCDNAIRYNNPDGRVDIIVSGDDKQSIVEVKDTGIGIPKEHQERIFERFYRVDKSRSKSTGGTGLGLAIVKHIVARHESAHMELESEPGNGTSIKVIFDKTTDRGGRI
ncbi:MAG: ATP-binding protein [Lachnospira sp.]